MGLVEATAYVQVAAFLSVFSYLSVALYQVKIERQVFNLMNTEVDAPVPETNADVPVYSHSHRNRTSMTFASEWESLSWEDKMRYLRLDQTLNWAAAGSGALAFICGLIWTHAEVNLGGGSGLGRGWLTVFGLLFAVGVMLLFRGYYQRWSEAQDDYLKVKHNSRQH